MPQKHYAQHGTFHVTTNAKEKTPCLVLPGVPIVLIEDLCIAKRIHDAKVYAFNVLPDHMHIILSPGPRGLSDFLHTFKTNSSRNIRRYLASDRDVLPMQPTRSHLNINALPRSRGYVTPAAGQGQRTKTLQLSFVGWQNGFHDERIRDNDQRTRALRYVRTNAYHHNLVTDPHDWPWTSLHFEHVLDPLEIWLS